MVPMHPQASKTWAAAINCTPALRRFRATDKRPPPLGPGQCLPGELPGRDESQGSGRAETF